MHRVVVISGYFNPLHTGHLDYIKGASELGDNLIRFNFIPKEIPFFAFIPFNLDFPHYISFTLFRNQHNAPSVTPTVINNTIILANEPIPIAPLFFGVVVSVFILTL